MDVLVSQYKQKIEEIVERLLRPYVDKQSAQTPSIPSLKEINDTVWQTIVLFPFETVILDSPLIQRLRYVRQLGVAHLIYPSAAHSRFEHSIGALNQVQLLINSIEKYHVGENEIREDLSLRKEWKNVLRLAALCHDVGHGFMSHVSEKAVDSLDEIQELKFELAKEFDKEKCSLAEAASYFALGSPAFIELVNLAKSKTNHQLPQNYSKVLQNAVIGKPIHDKYPLLHELISGPFDADKLDYMPRDAHMAGVPVVTDIPRLVQKVRLVEIERDKLPREIAKSVTGESASYCLQAVALSGARTLDELMIGRTLLFDKIYRHQKVRAAETMLASIVSAMVSFFDDSLATMPLLLNDDDIFNLTKEGLESKCQISVPENQKDKFEIMCDLSRRLRDRDLFVRAYAFSHNMPRDPLKSDRTHKHGIENLRRDMDNPEKRGVILEKIVDTIRIMRELTPEEYHENIDNNALPYYVTFDQPAPPDQTSEIARAYLVTGGRELIHFRDDFAESLGWSNAYPMTRDIGYVFSPRGIAHIVFLACEAIFRERYGIRTPSSALYYAKLDQKRVASIRRKLTEKGFYKDRPNELRAEPDRLGRADVAITIKEVVSRLGQYEGVCDSETDRRRTVMVDPERVSLFLRQFEKDYEVEAALSMVSSIKVLTRTDIHEAIDEFMKKCPDFHGAYVCPLGGPRDSSNVWTYYVEDLAGAYSLDLRPLQEALVGENKPIIFVDDFIVSGGQSRTILNTWMGFPDMSPLGEDHVLPLHTRLMEVLKARSLGFLFICGDADGGTRLMNDTKQLGLSAKIHIHIPVDGIPKAFDGDCLKGVKSDQREAFRTRCETIGFQLLKTAGKERSDEWCRDRALGYGNRGYLLVFPFNTPTQTLTLLWSGGKVDGWDWLPLVPRRAKK